MRHLTKDLKDRLIRFHRYLTEDDADGILRFGYPGNTWLRETIGKVCFAARVMKDPSGLTPETGACFGKSLGYDLMVFAMNAIKEDLNGKQVKGPRNYDRDNLDWHNVSSAGQLCDLGWAIMTRGEGDMI